MVNLDFYSVDENTGVKTKIGDAFSFENMFKGTQKKVPLTIFNSGDTVAVQPKVTFKQFPTGNFSECYLWKKISFMKNDNYGYSLSLPDIQPKSWLTGIDVYSEDFNNYPVVAGTKPDQSWLLWENSKFAWEVYNGWLQHNVDTIDGRALWTVFPSVKDFTFDIAMTIRDNVYGGILVRSEGDNNTGYIVLIQAMAGHLGNIPKNEGVIQVFSGKFTSGINSWKLLYTSPSIGIRGTHDPFRVKLKGNRFDFWYRRANEEEYESPLCSFIDNENLHTKASKPVILVHAGFGSVRTYFDDIKMEVENDNGIMWIENTVNTNTPVFSTQRSLLDIEYGGEE